MEVWGPGMETCDGDPESLYGDLECIFITWCGIRMLWVMIGEAYCSQKMHTRLLMLDR